MRFPAGLRARLLRRSFLQAFAPDSAPAILRLSPLVRHFPEHSHRDESNVETEWHSPKACVQAAEKAGAVAVWLGETEPLFHPAIGEITSALTDAGSYVFLHTSGVGLRKRIHEFKPVDQLFLSLEIPLGEADAQSSTALSQSVSLSSALEAIRVARLSGFHLCAHLTVPDAIDAAALSSRIRLLEPHRIDGIVMSSASSQSTAALRAATELIPSLAWRHFSRLLQSSYQNAVSLSDSQLVSNSQTQAAEACEESA